MCADIELFNNPIKWHKSLYKAYCALLPVVYMYGIKTFVMSIMLTTSFICNC